MRIMFGADAGFDMAGDHARHRRTKVLELVDILRIGEDRGGEALRLFAARLRGAVEHRFDPLVLEQAGVQCVGYRKTMFFKGGRTERSRGGKEGVRTGSYRGV